MKKSNFRKYIAYVKEQKQTTIEDFYIEKDYFLSLFLSTWQTLKEDDKVPHLDSLIFKGGTLLARNYLNYPRISEDLDFTHEDSNILRTIQSKGKRETEIRKRVIPIIDDIKCICDVFHFDFETDRTKTKYIEVRNSRAVYIFTLYYNSLITGEEIPIKLELNFLEQILHKPLEIKIDNIVDYDVFLKSIGYDLNNRIMKTYVLDEIILEKYRAILTRDALKERDILDLYLIYKKGIDVFKANNQMIVKKIQSGMLISPDLKKNLENNCQLLSDNQFGDSDDDLSRFTLVKLDENDYEQFKGPLYDKLKEVCSLYK
jgi:hypothetical protein